MMTKTLAELERETLYGATCYMHLIHYQWKRGKFMDWWNLTETLSILSFKSEGHHWQVCFLITAF